MTRPSFRNYVERRAFGDSELRGFAASLDDELLDARSWRHTVDIFRERGSDWNTRPSPEWDFLFQVRKLWDDYGDVCSTIARKQADARRS